MRKDMGWAKDLFLARFFWASGLAILNQFQVLGVDEVIAPLLLSGQSTTLNKLVDATNSHS